MSLRWGCSLLVSACFSLDSRSVEMASCQHPGCSELSLPAGQNQVPEGHPHAWPRASPTTAHGHWHPGNQATRPQATRPPDCQANRPPDHRPPRPPKPPSQQATSPPSTRPQATMTFTQYAFSPFFFLVGRIIYVYCGKYKVKRKHSPPQPHHQREPLHFSAFSSGLFFSYAFLEFHFFTKYCFRP